MSRKRSRSTVSSKNDQCILCCGLFTSTEAHQGLISKIVISKIASSVGHPIERRICPDCLGGSRSVDGEAVPSSIAINAANVFDTMSPKRRVYATIYGSMGSVWYARRRGIDRPVEFLHMAQDDWGQYSVNRTPELEEFVKSYKRIMTRGSEWLAPV